MKKIMTVLLILTLLVSFSALSESNPVNGTATVDVKKTNGTLHLRSEATTKSESLGYVKHGDEIMVLELGGEWSFIYSFRENKSGYIKTAYIKDFVPSDNVFTELYIEEITDSSPVYSFPGKYYADFDGDHFDDMLYARLFYDEYGMENFSVEIETEFGSTGEMILPYAIYSAGFAVAKLDDTDRVYIFVTGNTEFSSYETVAFYIDEGDSKFQAISPAAPFEISDTISALVTKIEDGIVYLEAVMDVLGTRGYEMRLKLDDGLLTAVDTVYTSTYSTDDPEVWEYSALTTQTALPCRIGGADAVLEADTQLIVTWLDPTEMKIGFTTSAGVEGEFDYEIAGDDYYGVDIGGLHEEMCFYSIPYAG